MPGERAFYTVGQLLQRDAMPLLRQKLDAALQENPALSGVPGATDARVRLEGQIRILGVRCRLPEPVPAPLFLDPDRIRTARPAYTPYGLMDPPYAGDAAVFTLQTSPAPIAAEAEIRLEAPVEAYNRAEIRANGRVRTTRRLIRFVLPARLEMDDLRLVTGLPEPDRLFTEDPEALWLDDFLLPVLTDARAMDRLAGRMLQEFMPECMAKPLPLDPYELARRMGLKLDWKLLSPDFSILGEIFHRKSKTAVLEVHSRQQVKNYAVEPGTILLDDRLRTGSHYPMQVIFSTLVHECAHWYKDRLYMALQDAFSPGSVLSVCRNSPVAHRSGLFDEAAEPARGNTPAERMESQALALPPHLLINWESGRKKVAEIVLRHGGITPQNISAILHELRDFFGVTLYAADRRLREFGYRVPAPARYARRFSYEPHPVGGIVYDIPLDRLAELTDEETHPAFLRLLETGGFILADFRLCMNRKEYIYYDAAGLPHLTPLAFHHPEACCYPFRLSPVRKQAVSSGAMAAREQIGVFAYDSDDPETIRKWGKQLLAFDTLAEEVKKVAGMPLGEEMSYHRRITANMTYDTWSAASVVSPRRLMSLCRDPVRPLPEYTTFLRAILGLKLVPAFSKPLLKKAKVDPPKSKEARHYIHLILSTGFMLPMLEIHRRLYDHGFALIEPGTLRENNYDERGYPLAYENLPHR